MFGFVERFITAKILETTRDHWLGDQTALEALIRFSDEELKRGRNDEYGCIGRKILRLRRNYAEN